MAELGWSSCLLVLLFKQKKKNQTQVDIKNNMSIILIMKKKCVHSKLILQIPFPSPCGLHAGFGGVASYAHYYLSSEWVHPRSQHV